MTLYDLYDQLADLEAEFEKKANFVSAAKAGLDPRAGFIHIEDDGIVVNASNVRVLNYYGGFEYVESKFVTKLGDLTIYSVDSSLVQECVDHYNEHYVLNDL